MSQRSQTPSEMDSQILEALSQVPRLIESESPSANTTPDHDRAASSSPTASQRGGASVAAPPASETDGVAPTSAAPRSSRDPTASRPHGDSEQQSVVVADMPSSIQVDVPGANADEDAAINADVHEGAASHADVPDEGDTSTVPEPRQRVPTPQPGESSPPPDNDCAPSNRDDGSSDVDSVSLAALAEGATTDLDTRAIMAALLDADRLVSGALERQSRQTKQSAEPSASASSVSALPLPKPNDNASSSPPSSSHHASSSRPPLAAHPTPSRSTISGSSEAPSAKTPSPARHVATSASRTAVISHSASSSTPSLSPPMPSTSSIERNAQLSSQTPWERHAPAARRVDPADATLSDSRESHKHDATPPETGAGFVVPELRQRCNNNTPGQARKSPLLHPSLPPASRTPSTGADGVPPRAPRAHGDGVDEEPRHGVSHGLGAPPRPTFVDDGSGPPPKHISPSKLRRGQRSSSRSPPHTTLSQADTHRRSLQVCPDNQTDMDPNLHGHHARVQQHQQDHHDAHGTSGPSGGKGHVDPRHVFGEGIERRDRSCFQSKADIAAAANAAQSKRELAADRRHCGAVAELERRLTAQRVDHARQIARLRKDKQALEAALAETEKSDVDTAKNVAFLASHVASLEGDLSKALARCTALEYGKSSAEARVAVLEEQQLDSVRKEERALAAVSVDLQRCQTDLRKVRADLKSLRQKETSLEAKAAEATAEAERWKNEARRWKERFVVADQTSRSREAEAQQLANFVQRSLAPFVHDAGAVVGH